jgi:addiction module HigA family antidote
VSDDGPTRPGEALRELVVATHGITQEQLARAMNVSRYSVNQLLNHRRAMTADMAVRLGKATSTSPEFWLALQRNVDLFEARSRLDQNGDLAAVQVIRQPVALSHVFQTIGKKSQHDRY